MSDRGSDLLQQASKPFSKRKVLLCDHLFGESRRTFRNTVKLLWPEATPLDIKKLEGFLMALRKSVPRSS